MTNRVSITAKISKGKDHTETALTFISNEEIDVWRTIIELQHAIDQLDSARDQLIMLSRDALRLALDGPK